MSDSKFYDEALDALYKAAKVSANFIEAALMSKDTDLDQARLKVALEVLKITWREEESDEDDED
ncbi:hypothetical protein [Iningainema tapete]|uniref:Uncharacterized protein n=1 Tax=Iningainema tapete BLCC-T55 TaxID=2748662 RepID=A0A8J6XNG7_9CYAN|nr:hypothetical protein [Iningainema tapete]MBD2775165.1 hypothetical protein [Iningainema tapete BLCC-T55]